MKLNFEWDEKKAKSNRFGEAATVFLDPLSITIPDHDHSAEEQRYIDIGSSGKGCVLVVVYTDRGVNIRIISCRKAIYSEKQYYEEKR